MRWMTCMALVLAACGVRADAPRTATPAPSTATAAVSPSAAPTAASTTAPSATPTLRPNPTAGPGTYTSLALAYRVDIPAGWRRSACQSTPGITQPPGTETFTAASVDEESATDIGAHQDVVEVHVEDAAGQTALQWLASGKLGQSVGTRYEAATIDGKDGARWVANDTGRALAYVINTRGRIYALSRGGRGTVVPANEAAASAIMSSIHVLSDAELATAKATLATPSPAPARTAEAVADTLARGFAQKDTAMLATVASPCLNQGYEQAGPSMAATSKMLAGLAQQFANGLTVTVAPRPLVDQSASYAAASSKWTGGGQPDRTAKLMIVAVGNTWYWDGWIFAQPVR